MEGTVWDVVIPPSVGSNARGGPTGGEDIHLPPPEHIRTVNCGQAYCRTVYGGR